MTTKGQDLEAATSTQNARAAVNGLTVRIAASGVELVSDVSLSVRAGEILGVVGESGSGKTTLGLAMIGHTRRGLEISAGEILVDGRDLLSMSSKAVSELRGTALAYVPQDPGTALNPARRIGSQMREVLTIHGRSRAEARLRSGEVLEEVGLDSVPHILDSFPHQLSGGQQQRVAIAMAFACRPGLIVMDEPTTGLDVSTQRTVLDTVKTLCSKYGVAAIYVSHDVAVVAELADRVAVVYAGRVVEIGTALEVLHQPQHPYTRGLLRAVPSAEKATRLVAMDGVRPQLGLVTDGCSFEPRCAVSTDRCTQVRPELIHISDSEQSARCLLVPDVARRETASPSVAQSAGTPTWGVRKKPFLEVSRLNAHYGAKQVLHDIDLRLAPNHCTALVGESGSGKTTLSRCLVGLHRSWTGAMRLGDEQLAPGIRGRSETALLDLQYIFQNPYASLNPRRTVGGLLAQPLEHFTGLTRKEQDSRVAETLESVSLPLRMLSMYPDQLSGGERQRVAIARALVLKPRVLVCDEVTSALDVSVQASVVEMLRRLQVQQSLSLLFVTHNLPLVRSIAQDVAVMCEGRIVEYGTVDEVLDNPKAAYTQRLINNLPKFDATTPIEHRDIGVSAG